ncbi:MAG: NTP transferase domain-containing protein [Bacteroidetes bacterium]|nr:NTP transferase domain-containing protein [Bacteroidota bacterium]
MKAMILAAGFGTRLGTAGIPKPLVPAAGRPMIAWVLDALRLCGCSDVVVNVHHHASLLGDYLRGTDFGLTIHIVEEQEILGTGGAVLNAAAYLDDGEPFLIHNADIHTAQDLRVFFVAHRRSSALATLLVNRRETSRALLFDDSLRLLGKEQWSEDGIVYSPDAKHRGFCGIHAVSGELFRLGFPAGFSDIFDIYRVALDSGYFLNGYETDAYWTDLGTTERIRAFNVWKSEHP